MPSKGEKRDNGKLKEVIIADQIHLEHMCGRPSVSRPQEGGVRGGGGGRIAFPGLPVLDLRRFWSG